ncbi:MAG: type I-G CRISPR-associated protein Csb2, partial [Solirubrobacteraceae bacterium]
MLRVTIRFPLGVYHAQSSAAFADPEWPPSPVRLIGALLAAAHEAPGVDARAARVALERLCDAPPPRVIAPPAETIADADGRATVALLRGASRWAPQNRMPDAGVSPRNLGRERAEVHKVGVAIGEAPVHFEWPDLVLGPVELERLERLAGEVTFIGTSRSPAIVTADEAPAPIDDVAVDRTWRPQPDDRIGRE